jgi:hypothetical protein
VGEGEEGGGYEKINVATDTVGKRSTVSSLNFKKV